MAVLLDLGREGAAARALAARLGDLQKSARQDGGQPIPFDRRVASVGPGLEQLAVLDEQKGVDDERRNRLEALVDPFGKLRDVEGLAAMVENGQPRAGFLVVNGKRAAVDELAVPLGQPGLLLNGVVAITQALCELGQAGVAEPVVVWPAVRKANARARAGLEGEVELPRQAAQQLRL